MSTPDKPVRTHRQIAEGGATTRPAQVPFVRVLSAAQPMQHQAQQDACLYEQMGPKAA